MLIGFDASRAFVSEQTGTENYSLNLLRALAKVDRKNRYRVYLRDFPFSRFYFPLTSQLANRSIPKWKINGKWQVANGKYGWPSNFEFVQIKPNRLWTQVGLALETWRNPVDVLFVPAHTLPVLRRRKILNSKLETLNPKQYQNTKIQNVKSLENSNLIFLNLFRISNLVIRILRFFAKETKYVVTIHDLGVEYLPNYHKFPQRYYLDMASKYAARHAEAIIAPSAATKADLVQRYHVNGKKVAIIAEGVDLKVFKKRSIKEIDRARKKYKLPQKYILFVGTIQPRKNLKMLIEAFSEIYRVIRGEKVVLANKSKTKRPLPNKHSDCQLVLAGRLGWDFKEIIEAPKRLGVERKVKFLKYVDYADLPALYSGARLFVFPSLFEGFGLPVLEAIACGTKVAASDIATNREIKLRLRKIGEAIVLIKPKAKDKWGRFLYQDISQYRKSHINISNEAKMKAISGILGMKFSWEQAARQTVSVFEKFR